MYEILDPMDKFNFMLGTWNLKYIVPKTQYSENDFGEGKGEFKRILNNKYVTFDYHAKLSKTESSAHAIFVWDKRTEIYRYWWFEDSGEFMIATCNFINENTLALNWHDSLLVQIFNKIDNDKIVLKMNYPKDESNYETILEVTFSRNKK
ncbi:MAG: hypothetical protein IPM32_00195 [Ignavibacteriae bacterium]|nr:hypothetical protein [Ignavibacteriota bacterium]